MARASSRDHDSVVAQSKIDEVFPSLVSYDAMAAVLDDQQVYQRRRRLPQAKLASDATAMSLSHNRPLNRCNLNSQLHPATRSNWNLPEASGSMANLRGL